ncbi:hypothetical protein CKK33_17305 [Mucilaginibacter sp. MD40]|uniref:hypothetical protein n=1 Tax=Mucilaginibacter sp. MD40 TaxID=2029590 RepID=UPI000BAC6C64|nr:hypothetical protein [Mucilaginibacter sp. MD40]PAW95159.1 hypothetical protein CKK33_17305 [Mucilaginibacter sp. MD40]
MNKHLFWMIIGCTVPLLLIFLLPLFGITGNYSFLIFIVLMFGCHFMMMGRHSKHYHSSAQQGQDQPKEDRS